jgi:hypothetical protein
MSRKVGGYSDDDYGDEDEDFYGDDYDEYDDTPQIKKARTTCS